MSQTETLLHISRLKAILYERHQSKKISLTEFGKINKKLDELNFKLNEPISYDELQNLLADCSDTLNAINFQSLHDAFHHERLHAILALRQNAIDQQQITLDISNYVSGINQVTLPTFNWQQPIDDFETLCQSLKQHQDNFEQILQCCQRFFHNQHQLSYPSGYPKVTEKLFSQLTSSNIIKPQQQIALANNLSQINQTLDNNRQQLTQQFLSGRIEADKFITQGATAYQILFDQTLSQKNNDDTLANILSRWSGINKISLLKQWLTENPKNKKTIEIIAACTGIDPTLKAPWKQWSQQQIDEERQGYHDFIKQLNNHRELYDLAFIISCESLLKEDVKNLWFPILTARLQQQKKPQKESSATIIAKEIPTSSIKKSPPIDDEHFTLEDEVDQLTAPTKKQSKDDIIVASHSTWNQYLKPFLSETWTGLIGITLLMAAWLFLSMWVWDKGEYYRLVAGAIPMLLITLSTAWITRFFHRLKDQGAAHIVVEFFAIICIFSLPFNHLLSASLINSNGLMGNFLAVALATSYFMLTPIICRWTEPAYGIQIKNHLNLIHLLIYTPAIIAIWLPHYLTVTLNSLPFIGLFLLYRLMKVNLSRLDYPKKYNAFLFSSHFLIIILTAFIFYRTLPNIAATAIFIQLIALFIFRRFKQTPTLVIIASSISLFANILCWQHAEILPLSILLSLILWFKQRSYIDVHWPNEIIAFHLLALFISIANALDFSNIGLMTSLIIALVFIKSYEKAEQIGEIQFLSFTLILFHLTLAYWIFSDSTQTMELIFLSTSLLLSSLLTYRRFTNRYLQKLWFIQLALMIFLPISLVDHHHRLNINEIALYFSLFGLIWISYTHKAFDSLSQIHRSTVSGFLAVLSIITLMIGLFDQVIYQSLWLMLSAVSCIAVLFTTTYRTQSSIWVYVTFITIGLCGLNIKLALGIIGTSGLGSAIGAIVFLTTAVLLHQQLFSSQSRLTDTFFGKKYFLQSDDYLWKPFEQLGWLAVLTAIISVLKNYAPLDENFKLGITLIICIGLLSIATLRFNSQRISQLSFIPVLILFSIICISFPPEQWSFVIGFEFLLIILFTRHTQAEISLLQKLYKPTSQTLCKALTFAYIPAGFAGYALLIHSPIHWMALFGIFNLFISHWHLVKHGHQRYVHVFLLHVLTLWTLAYLNTQMPESIHPFLVLHWLIGCLFLWIGLSYWLERQQKHPLDQPYVVKIQSWMMTYAIVYVAILILIQMKFTIDYGLLIYTALGLLFIQFTNRFQQNNTLLLIKSILCMMAGLQLTDHLLWGLITGIVIYSLSETLFLFSNRYPKLRLQSINPNNLYHPYYNIGLILTGWLIGFIVIHFLMFLSQIHTKQTLPSYLLYALIPYALYFKQKVPQRYQSALTYIVLASFTYANVFVALNYLPQFKAHELTALHIINLALVITIASFFILSTAVDKLSL
ncbi:MAG: hypothetical protein HON94_01895, partial [Methylococcales bacterium]|nr:hypothetical protein [Methylococcales bacterium]